MNVAHAHSAEDTSPGTPSGASSADPKSDVQGDPAKCPGGGEKLETHL